MKKTLWVFLAICSLGVLAESMLEAQEGRLLRLEFEIRPNTEPFTVIPLGNEGFFLLFPTEEKVDNHRTWVIQHYNTQMKAEWKREEVLGDDYYFIDWEYVSGKANLFFSGKGDRGKQENSTVVTLDPVSASARRFDFYIPDKEDAYFFDVEGPWFVLASRNRKYETSVMMLGADGVLKEVETGLEEEYFLDDALWNPGKQELNLLFKHRLSRKEQGLALLSVDIQGKVERIFSIYEDKTRWPSSGHLLLNDSAEVVLFGTYSRDERTTSFQNQSPTFETASGLITAVINDSISQNKLNYFPFSEFNDYFNYLTYQDVSRLRSGRNAEQNHGIDFNIILHELKIVNGKVVMLAEAYFEKYQYVTRMAYDYYGRPVPTSYSVFEGYEYTNAFIAGFDQYGEKLWDNNFEFRNFREMRRQKRVDALPDSEDLVLAYMDDGYIASKIIRGSEVVGAFDVFPLEGKSASDRVENGDEEQIRYWYDSYALCYGYQTIRSVTSPTGDKRNVFYISKITYK